MSKALRILLVALIALISGPRVTLAADGEWVTLCAGASGAGERALFDFETGAPVEPELRIEICDLCLVLDTAAPPRAPERGRIPVALRRGAVADHLCADQTALHDPSARAPPLSFEV